MKETKAETKHSIINRIELELLSTLLNYAVPFIDTKIKPKQKVEQKASNLEQIANSKPKVGIKDVNELESLLLKNISGNVKVNKNIGISKNDMFYSWNLRRQKNKDEKDFKYSISIEYQENQEEEKIKIKVQKDAKDAKEIYSAEITNKKEAKDKIIPYKVSISYEDNYSEERLSITYRQQLKNYIQEHTKSKEDMSNRVPLKWLNILPETMMGGVLGFTYLGENFMARRADLTGSTARMVDIHESIHTPDEYETRRLTLWIMSKERSKYIK